MEKEKISKTEELENWKARLYELSSEVAKQIKWAEQPAVFATKNPNCPEELNEVADHLIDLQNKFGEYQRNQINSKENSLLSLLPESVRLRLLLGPRRLCMPFPPPLLT